MSSGPNNAHAELERAKALRERANDQRGEIAELAERFSKLARHAETVEPAVS